MSMGLNLSMTLSAPQAFVDNEGKAQTAQDMQSDFRFTLSTALSQITNKLSWSWIWPVNVAFEQILVYLV